ncbi:MAG: hypothetical protein Q8R29_00835 [bacterium]|nr:hypothetical protein [bacterium]
MSAEMYAALILVLSFVSFYCFTIYFRNISITATVLICIISLICSGAWVYVNFVLNLVPLFWAGYFDTRKFSPAWRGLFLGWWVWFLLMMTSTGLTAVASFLTLFDLYNKRISLNIKKSARK